ncbi:MAG: response regulator, partial [Gammaproteobacteria bacterium]
MPSFLIVSDTEDFRVLLAQLLAIEWPDVEVEDWELRSDDKTPTPWPRVDLVLLDCGASHSEGLEWLRGAPAPPERPPIIALSDPEDSEATAQAVALGAAACLSRRDVSRVRLTAAINAVLRRQIVGIASAETAVDAEKTLLLSELGVEHLPSATIVD